MSTGKRICSNKKEGSTLLAAVFILTVLGIVYGSIISRAMTERRINVRHEARLEAKAAAESLVEFGFTQLHYKFSIKTNLDQNLLDTNGSDKLKLPPITYFGSKVDTDTLELIGGKITTNGSSVFIDPKDPINFNDPMKGKRVFTKEVSVFGKASVIPYSGAPPVTAHVVQKFQVRDSPLFSHAIFYNLDLDIHPGPVMDIYGPVHTNGNLRLQSVHGLNFHDQVTVAGDLQHQYEHEGPRNDARGNITFKNAAGAAVNMKNVHGNLLQETLGVNNVPDKFIESSDGGFRAAASQLWDGNLLTKSHGVEKYQPVQFPNYKRDDSTTTEYDPINTGHDLIEPLDSTSTETEIEDQKMAGKAGLYFKWDTSTNELKAQDGDGKNLNINQLEGLLWTHKEKAFEDRRRNNAIDIIDIDVGYLKKLIETPGKPASENFPSYDLDNDWNGIVYFESYNSKTGKDISNTGVRLYNGQNIPDRGTDKGMTFVTNNALYIRGNYNADGTITSTSATDPDDTTEPPAAVMADTVTFQSTKWDDAYSFLTSDPENATEDRINGYGMQRAGSTEISVAIVAGITPENMTRNGVNSTYNGGAHNFPRFLEDWDNKTFAIRGSLVCLFESETDWSIFSCCKDYYTPPDRAYGFNALFDAGNYPPGTPMLRTYKRPSLKSLSASEYSAAIPWTASP